MQKTALELTARRSIRTETLTSHRYDYFGTQVGFAPYVCFKLGSRRLYWIYQDGFTHFAPWIHRKGANDKFMKLYRSRLISKRIYCSKEFPDTHTNLHNFADGYYNPTKFQSTVYF